MDLPLELVGDERESAQLVQVRHVVRLLDVDRAGLRLFVALEVEHEVERVPRPVLVGTDVDLEGEPSPIGHERVVRAVRTGHRGRRQFPFHDGRRREVVVSLRALGFL
jgi:hypothetical protein